MKVSLGGEKMSKKGFTVFKKGYFWQGGDCWSTLSTDAHVGSFGQASAVAKLNGGDVISIEVICELKA